MRVFLLEQTAVDAPLKAPEVNRAVNGDLFMSGEGYLGSNPVTSQKKSPLRLGKKIYEFYTAPITKFWMHTVCIFASVLSV